MVVLKFNIIYMITVFFLFITEMNDKFSFKNYTLHLNAEPWRGEW